MSQTTKIPLLPAEMAHMKMLAKWRKAMDLVGPGPLEPHFEDAAMAMAALKPVQGLWADLGSGAGFPGVALAARHPTLQVQWVESRQRRVAFLKRVIGPLSNAEIMHQRSEDLPDGAYMGLVSRAYKPPAGVFEDARRLLAPGGHVVLMRAALDVDAPPDFEMFHVEHYTLTDGRERCLFQLKRLN
jgi:16S rRNA (guanine527-N7)-methyltransferase